MTPKLLKTEAEHAAALAHVESLMGAAPGTPQADELELWSHLVAQYEDEHEPIPLPDPIAAIRFRMEQQGLTAADLVPYLGSRSKVAEVLNGRRKLSLAMVRKLHDGLGIPLDVLVHEPEAMSEAGRHEARR